MQKNKIVSHTRAKAFTKIQLTLNNSKTQKIEPHTNPCHRSNCFTGPLRPKLLKFIIDHLTVPCLQELLFFILKIVFSPFRVRIIESQLYTNKNQVRDLSFLTSSQHYFVM